MTWYKALGELFFPLCSCWASLIPSNPINISKVQCNNIYYITKARRLEIIEITVTSSRPQFDFLSASITTAHLFIHVKSWPLIKFHVLSFSTSELGLVAGRSVGVCGSRSIQERFVCLHLTIMMVGISISFRAFGSSIDIKSSIFLLYSEIPNTLSTVLIGVHQKNANISLLRLKVCLALKTDYLHMKRHRLHNESTIWVIDCILRPVKTFRIYIFSVSYDILRRYVRKLQGYDYEDETFRTRMIRYFFCSFTWNANILLIRRIIKQKWQD